MPRSFFLARVNGTSFAAVIAGNQPAPAGEQEDNVMQRISRLMGGAAMAVVLWAPMAGAQTVTQTPPGSAQSAASTPGTSTSGQGTSSG